MVISREADGRVSVACYRITYGYELKRVTRTCLYAPFTVEKGHNVDRRIATNN